MNWEVLNYALKMFQTTLIKYCYSVYNLTIQSKMMKVHTTFQSSGLIDLQLWSITPCQIDNWCRYKKKYYDSRRLANNLDFFIILMFIAVNMQ